MLTVPVGYAQKARRANLRQTEFIDRALVRVGRHVGDGALLQRRSVWIDTGYCRLFLGLNQLVPSKCTAFRRMRQGDRPPGE